MGLVEIKTETTTVVTVNERPLRDVLDVALELAHGVLEELSIYRHTNYDQPIEEFDCEALACKFLDMVGD